MFVKIPNSKAKALAVCLLSCFLLACGKVEQSKVSTEYQGKVEQPKLSTEYQAVYMNNGQVFLGKIENTGSDYPLLRDVFYVQTKVNPETKEATNNLIKRGNEWHGPEYMYVSAKHIVAIEPLSPDSRLAQLIKEAKTPKAPAAQ